MDKKTYDMLRKSIVKITHPVYIKKEKRWAKSCGTGFICNNPHNEKEYIITAKHVINIDKKLYKTPSPLNSSIIFPMDNNKIISIENCHWISHREYDIAALAMDELILQADKKSTQIDYECISSEKIIDDDDFIRSKDTVSINVMSPYAWDNGNSEGRSGETIKLFDEESDAITHFLIDCKCEGMDSGSPIYINKDIDMELIGILSGGGKFDYSSLVRHVFSSSNQFKDQHLLLDSHPDLKFLISKDYGFCVNSNILIKWFESSSFINTSKT